MPNQRSIKRSIVYVCIVLLLGYLVFYLIADRVTPNTNDAYVEAHVIQIAPRVSGRVVNVAVHNNQWVQQGSLLFSLDNRVYQHALLQAKAQLEEANANIASLQAQKEQVLAHEQSARADEVYALKHYQALKMLANDKAISSLHYQSALDAYRQAKQQLTASEQAVQNISAQLQQHHGQYAQVALARARYQQAKQNLANTKVYAPFSGRTSFVRVSEGAYIKSGAPVIALIDMRHIWVIARIKENNLSLVKRGDWVDVSPELYPGYTFQGHVASIGWGVNLFASIPPVWMPYVPSTRNWVRLAQRFPVQINFPADPAHPLRVGSTVAVTIYTKKTGLIVWLSEARQRIESWLQYFY